MPHNMALVRTRWRPGAHIRGLCGGAPHSSTLAGKSMSVTKEEYVHEAQFALFGCQLAEAALKSFLMYARDINALAPAEFASIRQTDDELEEIPLGGLIKLGRTAKLDVAILAQLEELRPLRNHCAHKALLMCFVSDFRKDVDLSVEYARILRTRTLAWASVHAVQSKLDAMSKSLESLREAERSGT